MTFLTGARSKAPSAGGSPSAPGTTSTAPAKPEPVPLPSEIRGVHVTAALASLNGKLDEYLSLTGSGLTALELDVKDENGEVGFRKGAPRSRGRSARRSPSTTRSRRRRRPRTPAST